VNTVFKCILFTVAIVTLLCNYQLLTVNEQKMRTYDSYDS